MIRADMQLVRPDEATASVTLTMTVGEFRKLADQLKDGDYWPCGKVSALLRDIVFKAHQSFSERVEKE